ncbi:MAG: ligand-binding sensor domain-containing protein, partial [Candidatus Kariarchaeaceae archaeon]
MSNKVQIVRLLIVFSFLLISKLSFPQNRDYEINSITTKDGLVNGCIHKIIQDSKGFMWFATEGGLNRYDGYNIKLYDCKQKVIRTIFEDPADSGKALWIGTIGGGLLKFNRNSERFIQYQHNADDPNSISNDDVHCIYKDRSGIYWIGTDGGGLNSFDRNTGKFISYRNNPNDPTSISSNFVRAICEDYLDNLWVGNSIGGLDRFDRHTNKFIHYKHDPNDSTKWGLNHIRSLYEDSEKTLWIGTSFTLFKYDRENDQFIRPVFNEKDKQFSTYNNIFSIIEDKEKTLWITSPVEGVTGISSDRNYFRYSSKEMNSTVPSSVCIDQSGIIWVGTYCQGINKIIPRKKYFNHYKYTLTDSSNLEFRWTHSFFEDKKDDLWIGTNEGLRKLENGKLLHYPILIDGIIPPIYKIYKSKTGKLWLACEETLTEFDPQTKKYINYDGKYIVYSSPVINLIENLVKDSSEIASIKKVTNNQNLTNDFIIDKSTPVIVLCTGEGNLSELFDYGWITMAGDENPIWKMNPESSRNFGGSFKNRDQISLLTLKPGKYRLHYQSDDKHTFGDWIGKAPLKPELWGISVFPISPSVYQTYKNEIEKIHYKRLHFTDIGNVVEDNEGRVWGTLATEENTVHFLDKVQKQFIPYQIIIDGQSFPEIERIYKDHSGMLWFKTRDNILIRKDFNGKCEIKFVLKDFIGNKKSKLNNNAIGQVYEDSQRNFWIGTDIGLFEYNLASEKIDHHKFVDFNLPNTIEGIVEDNNGKLWISTSKNLIKFDPGQNVLRKYDGRDGLPDIKFAENSSIKLKDGRLAFGGSIGFVIFHPDSIKDNEVPPEIAITGFQIFNKLTEVGEDSP